MLEGFIANLSSWLLSISGGSLIMVAVYAGVFVAVMTTLGAFLPSSPTECRTGGEWTSASPSPLES